MSSAEFRPPEDGEAGLLSPPGRFPKAFGRMLIRLTEDELVRVVTQSMIPGEPPEVYQFRADVKCSIFGPTMLRMRDPIERQRLLDYLANFKAIMLDVATGEFEAVSPLEADRVEMERGVVADPLPEVG